MENEIEIWKDIIDFEGMYQVSNLGAIRSLDRIIISSNGRSVSYKGKLLSQMKINSGYWAVCLHKNGIRTAKTVHRLVAIHHIPNPTNLPEVNHLFGYKDDNRACVLEWSSRVGNARHAVANGLCKKAAAKASARMKILGKKHGYNHALKIHGIESQKIIVTNVRSNEIFEFKSLREMEKKLKLDRKIVSEKSKKGLEYKGYSIFIEKKMLQSRRQIPRDGGQMNRGNFNEL